MSEKNAQRPPRLARNLFVWWSRKADTEDLLGDIDEYFLYNLEEFGKFKARVVYFKQVLSLSFSYALRSRKRSSAYSPYAPTGSLAMMNNYFKIALRNFSKHKLFASINILGLAMGMSICLLALGVSVSIYRSDEFHKKKDRIYQINTSITSNTGSKTFGSTFNAVGDYMKQEYPFIEHVVKIKDGFHPEFRHHNNSFNFEGHFADPSFFEVFDFQMISGNPKTALAKPFSLVLTASVAEVLFKDQNAIGQTLETEHGVFTVTGVMDDLKQTHFYFKVLTSYETYIQLQSGIDLKSDWENFRDNYVYLLLRTGVVKSTLKASLEQVSALATEFNADQTIRLESIALNSVVPRWNISNALGIGWDQPSIIFFMSVGLLILLPAVFNYINLSIARALKRSKEIGIRKVVGADKGQIKAQFIVETVLLTFLAMIGSLFIFVPLRNEFLDMVAAAEVLDTSVSFNLVAVFVLFTLTVGLISGAFPALYFSRMSPLQTLKGDRVSKSVNVSGIKKGLFVFQFFLSLIFIIGVGAIAKQYTYVFSQNHGFESDNVLMVPFGDIDKQLAINELKNHTDVKSVTMASHAPGVLLRNTVSISPNDIDTLDINQAFIGNDFIENFQMKLAWGETDGLSASNRNEEFVLVNKQFMRSISVFNVQRDSLTFTLEYGTQCRIVGILEDFNFEPLTQHILPLAFRYSLEESKYAFLTINSSDIGGTIDELSAVWQAIDQNASFEATFLDDEIEEAYYFLAAQIKIFSYLSAFAITISCLGLLGMVSYTTENRVKEIAIRKIVGATNSGLYYLLTKDFVKLILIAGMLAIPFSYVFYDRLFLYFLIPHGSGLGILEVLSGIIFLFLVGFVTIFWQTSKVANTNPARNLRHE